MEDIVTQKPKTPAEVYEEYMVPAIFTPWARVLLTYAAPKPGERVLDVACGTGAVSRQVAPIVGAKGKVTGLEISAAMLAVARSIHAPAGAQIDWREGDATSLPFADRSFDLVTKEYVSN